MNDLTQRPVRRALISVSDKTGIIEFAKALNALGIEILSTGGTAKTLIENMIPVLEVSLKLWTVALRRFILKFMAAY